MEDNIWFLFILLILWKVSLFSLVNTLINICFYVSKIAKKGKCENLSLINKELTFIENSREFFYNGLICKCTYKYGKSKIYVDESLLSFMKTKKEKYKVWFIERQNKTIRQNLKGDIYIAYTKSIVGELILNLFVFIGVTCVLILFMRWFEISVNVSISVIMLYVGAICLFEMLIISSTIIPKIIRIIKFGDKFNGKLIHKKICSFGEVYKSNILPFYLLGFYIYECTYIINENGEEKEIVVLEPSLTIYKKIDKIYGIWVANGTRVYQFTNEMKKGNYTATTIQFIISIATNLSIGVIAIYLSDLFEKLK